MEDNIYWANISCAANRATSFRLLTKRLTERWMDRSYSEKRQGTLWSSCPHLDLVNRAACQNDHTWCHSFSFSVSVSTQSLQPLLRESVTPLTHTHFLAQIHSKEDGLNHGQESSHVHCPFSQSSSTQTFPQLSKSLPVFCCSLFLLLSQRPGSFSYLHHLPTGREQ